MSRFLIICCLICVGVGVPMTSWAQEDDELPTYTAWQVTRLDEDGNPEEGSDSEAPANTVAVLELDEGNTLLIVWAGPDILYELQEDGTYSGHELVDATTYEFSATLEVLDDDTMTSYSVTETERFTFETTIIYERTDAELMVYTELDRTVIEYTQFTDCLGASGEVGRAWITSDLLVPFQISEDSLIWNEQVFTGGGGSYVSERTQPFASFENFITQTFTGTADGFDYEYHAIANERDDCEMIYESSYVPFDHDFEALYGRAETEAAELAEDTEE